MKVQLGKYAPTMKQMGIPDDRLARCKKDYADRYTAWNQLLEPFQRLPAKK